MTDTIVTSEQSRFKDDLDVLKHLVNVHDKDLTKDLSADIVLAKSTGSLTEKDKVAFIELVHDAKSIRYLMNRYKAKPSYQWDKSKKGWVLMPMSEMDKQYIEVLGDTAFNLIADQIKICAEVNRNVEKNPIIDGLIGRPKDEETQTTKMSEETGNFLDKFTKQFKKKRDDDED